ncbi:unnamed protein product [Rotaria magnacalcarata]|uniref:EGF-like domain-containing protein n=2 Tax=Rotaria magnacalcarata TaxID=392030 RepID=A0A815G7K5_9BILA|nr:unnamed protein product [Rotaria magnacalcarata]
MGSLYMFTIIVLSLSTRADAFKHRSDRQIQIDQCLNPDVDICDFIECENGGSCMKDSTTTDCFKCICVAGFTGKICETTITILPNECDPGCQNGGICIDNRCECNAGFTGNYCEIQDYCSPTNPCRNGGRCTSSSSSFMCDCTGTGYTGPTCADIVSTNPCASNPCQNGGSCYPNNNSFVCVCRPSWTGMTCTQTTTTTTPSVSPCLSNPCKNGGNCYTNSNSFVCVCRDGWAGATCTEATTTAAPSVSPCASGPCRNGGRCYNSGDSYFCYCGPTNTYSGKNCEIVSSGMPSECQLSCGSGYCISTGSSLHPNACMCGSTVQPTICT